MKIDTSTIVIVVVAALLGGAGGYWFRGTTMPRLEVTTPMPEIDQTDGSKVAARAPPPMAEAILPGLPARPTPPPHRLPKGSVEERRLTATVKPTEPNCPPVDFNLSLVRDDEGGRRAVVSSPSGTVIRAQDMPIEAAMVPAPRYTLASGVIYDPNRGLSGVWIEKDFARIRIGADLVQHDRGTFAAMVRVGLLF